MEPQIYNSHFPWPGDTRALAWVLAPAWPCPVPDREEGQSQTQGPAPSASEREASGLCQPLLATPPAARPETP